MSLSIQLVDSIDKITKEINVAIANQVNDILSQKIGYISNEVKRLIKPLIESFKQVFFKDINNGQEESSTETSLNNSGS